MKKTFVTNMPDHIGAFLKASKCFSQLGINITRVSYNKAVDCHTLFIDVDGDQVNIDKAGEALESIGYLQNGDENSAVVLLQFRLEDKPGSVTGVLELINEFNFNISYISSQENGTEYQLFKMGLFVNDPISLSKFLDQARKLCEVELINYNHTEKNFDNGIFYSSYVDALVNLAELTEDKKQTLLVNVNFAMQTLDEQGLSPYKTFESISKFAELLSACKRDKFKPRITKHVITDNTTITLIEPDCGSNTAIIESDGERIFVDSGYACYKNEMLAIIKELFPDFKTKKERIIITHADVDHCGLLNEFDQVIVSEQSSQSLKAEWENSLGLREQNPLHKPYVNICKTLTEYTPVDESKLITPWRTPSLNATIEQVGFFSIGELNFEVYEGKGGHLPGEIMLIDFEHRLAFTGDVFINLNDLTEKQAQYNQYAPILMTSVDTDAKLCAKERNALLQRLGAGEWSIFGGHGQKKLYRMVKEK